MHKRYENLQNLLAENSSARKYFDRLPDYVRESIQSRGGNVKTYESLKDYAENLLRGDD